MHSKLTASILQIPLNTHIYIVKTIDVITFHYLI